MALDGPRGSPCPHASWLPWDQVRTSRAKESVFAFATAPTLVAKGRRAAKGVAAAALFALNLACYYLGISKTLSFVSGCPAKSKVSSVARAQIGLKEVQRGRELLTLSSDGAQGEQGRDKTSFHGVFHYILRETDILAAKVVHPGPRGE